MCIYKYVIHILCVYAYVYVNICVYIYIYTHRGYTWTMGSKMPPCDLGKIVHTKLSMNRCLQFPLKAWY